MNSILWFLLIVGFLVAGVITLLVHMWVIGVGLLFCFAITEAIWRSQRVEVK